MRRSKVGFGGNNAAENKRIMRFCSDCVSMDKAYNERDEALSLQRRGKGMGIVEYLGTGRGMCTTLRDGCVYYVAGRL